MKLISWNVNGLRACLKKGFYDFFHLADGDIFCVQETKMQEGQAEIILPGYHQYFHSAIKKGYSGTAVFTKKIPTNIYYGIEGNHIDEGRIMTMEYESFYLINLYSPNAQAELARIDYRMAFENDLRNYIQGLKEIKPVILCGDLNVAHKEIDLKNPKSNQGNPGFSMEEREKFGALLATGMTDSFRYLYPNQVNAYTWWSYRFQARSKNIGWRIDYFLVSKGWEEKILESNIYPEILGSDHCPIGLVMDI